MGISASLFQAFLQHGAPDQCFHSCSTPPSAHPSRGEPVSRRPRPPRPVTFLHLHLGRPPGLQYRRAAPQGQGTLGPAHPAEHPAGRSRREGGVLNTPVPAPLGPVPTSPRSAAAPAGLFPVEEPPVHTSGGFTSTVPVTSRPPPLPPQRNSTTKFKYRALAKKNKNKIAFCVWVRCGTVLRYIHRSNNYLV